jgi:gluconate kinase
VIVIVFGVSGAAKTTVGELLARELDWHFLEADDFHPAANDEVKLVFLRGSYAVIAEQLRHRRGHFMDPMLLKSQFDDLEEPQPDESALTIELGPTPQELVKEIKEKLHLS